MQNNTLPFEMGGWTYILFALLVSTIVLLVVYLRGKAKEKRLIAEGRIEIIDPAIVSRQGDRSAKEAGRTVATSYRTGLALDSRELMAAMATDTRSMVYAQQLNKAMPKPMVGMSDLESLESIGQTEAFKYSMKYSYTAKTDSIGSAFYDDMPEGSWG